MSDWQAGDLAVCIYCDPGPQVDPWEPVVGQTYTVVRVGPLDIGWPDGTGLDFQDDPTCGDVKMWDAGWFRKIRPDKHEACEDEFITLLKRRKVAA